MTEQVLVLSVVFGSRMVVVVWPYVGRTSLVRLGGIRISVGHL